MRCLQYLLDNRKQLSYSEEELAYAFIFASFIDFKRDSAPVSRQKVSAPVSRQKVMELILASTTIQPDILIDWKARCLNAPDQILPTKATPIDFLIVNARDFNKKYLSSQNKKMFHITSTTFTLESN